MIGLGLTSTNRKKYAIALHGSRVMEVTVAILDRNEKPLGSLTSSLLDGVINVDSTAAVSRSCSIAVLDPDRKLHLDPDSPSATALFADRFLRITRSDYVDTMGDFVDCPVFWGPITRFERTRNVVQIEAMGKEVLLLEPAVAWTASTYRKGALVVDVIRDLLERAGEARFSLPTLAGARLPSALAVAPHEQRWVVAKRLAKSVNRQLFYDGMGRACLRPFPSRVVWTFGVGEQERGELPSIVLDDDGPRRAYEFAATPNVIEVLGPNPTGKKARIRYVAVPRSSHPYSPQSLARNGKPRYLVKTIESDKIKRLQDAKEIGDRELEDAMRLDVQLEFSSIPIPHLEEMDLCELVEDGVPTAFRLQQFTIPLTSAETMSVGSLKRVKQKRARRKRRR